MDLHVSNIPFKWKDKDLEALFEQFGPVLSAKIIIDKITRQNKGFGFVTMKNIDDAERAMGILHGTEHEGRAIAINPSMPKGEIKKPFRTAKPKKKEMEFKSDKHKKSLPPWLRKEY